MVPNDLPLISACKENDIDRVRQLISNTKYIDEQDEDGLTQKISELDVKIRETMEKENTIYTGDIKTLYYYLS